MVWIIIGSILLGLLFIVATLSIVGYRVVFHSPKKWQNNDYNKVKKVNYEGISGKVNNLVDQILKIPYEDLYIESYDGLKLHGYLYKSEGSNEYVILFHGYRRTARRSFCGLAMDLLKENKNVILVDQRAHGQSEGHQTTFGKKEQYDVADWVKYAREHFGEDSKIIIGGVSLGAANVLMALDKIDENVKVIADSPYYSIEDVFKQTIRNYKLPVAFFYPLAIITARIFCHMDLKSDIPTEIKNSKNKILIIHSVNDNVVPYQLSEKICKENENHVQLSLFEGHEHGFSYLRQTVKYKEVYFAFLNE